MRVYTNAKVVTKNSIEQKCVICSGGKILSVSERFDKNDGDEIIDCKGRFLSPGFVDIHVHGGGGFSAMSNESGDIVKMCRAHALSGTTSIVPTTLASPVKRLQSAMLSIEKAMCESTDCNILGIHLEGPFISPLKRGAQSPEDILVPTKENVSALLDFSKHIVMMGAAPEIEGGMALGEEIARHSAVASVAHSDAGYDIAEEALSHGYSDVTHIYSACSAMHKNGIFREVGVVEAGLSLDGYTTQFIGDLRHLPKGALCLIYKAKGASSAYAVSDGLEYSAMNMKEGTVIKQENGLEVLYEDSVMKLADRSCLAGSVATMSSIVKNLYKTVGISLPEAVKMASLTPLSVIGFSSHKGKIAAGFDEDIILFDEDVNISLVCVDGKLILNKS